MRETSPTFFWVSPYSPDDARGGWKSMQFKLLRELETRLGTADRIAPVQVSESLSAKWHTRILKKLGIPRPYAYLSERRLSEFARVVDSRIPASRTKPVVFFESQLFVKCRPGVPYYIYTDGAFFIHYWEYNRDHSHSQKDIQRICDAEAAFMRDSARVWCSSQWVSDRITKEYKLEPGKAICVGTGGGNVPEPVEPIEWQNSLVMIGADFERKRGHLAIEAVAAARALGSDIRIQFIGAKPSEDLMGLKYVEWCGWIDHTKDDDRRKFSRIMSSAGAHILLSRIDLTPLAIPEAASFCKATFASSVGGIPEMIRDGVTGWLVPADAAPAQIGAKLHEVFSGAETLAKAGIQAREWCEKAWSWKNTAARCVQTMRANCN